MTLTRIQGQGQGQGYRDPKALAEVDRQSPYGANFLPLFVPPWLFTSPRLRLFGHYGREVNRRHVRLSCARDWCHLNFGTQPGSFVQRQAGDLFHAGAAVLAVVFINNK